MSKIKEYLQTLRSQILNSCNKCDHSGWHKSEMCDCLKRFMYYYDLYEANIDKEFWDLSFNDWGGDELAKQKVIDYLNKFESMYEEGRGIVFTGQNGTGKTFLAVQILKHVLTYNLTHNRDLKIYFISFAELINIIRSKIDNPLIEELYYKIKNVNFLCIDNADNKFLSSNITPYMLTEFDILSRQRKRDLLPTIITTPLNESEFTSSFSLISNLFENHSIFINVIGPNYRMKKFKNINGYFK